MLDLNPSVSDHPAPRAQTARLQRSAGAARVKLVPGSGGVARLADLAQQGCAKAMLPRVHGPEPEVVFLNTAGGITGGDRLSYTLELEAGARATGATQTAERAYRSSSDAEPGVVGVNLSLGARTRLDWLPQETILFDASDLSRRTDVEMAGDATLLWAETLVFGRAAMGETLASFVLRDDRRIRRGGRLAVWEPLRLTPGDLVRFSGLGGARAISTVVFLTQGAESALDPVRRLSPQGVEWAASAWDGKLVVRALASDAQPLKQALAQVLEVLRDGRALPRVWQI